MTWFDKHIHYKIQPVHPKGDQSWVFIGRNDAKAETPVLSPIHLNSWLVEKDTDAGKDWGQEERKVTEMVGWHHWLNGHEFKQTVRDSEGQGSLECCSIWGCKESDETERLNNNEQYISKQYGTDIKTEIYTNGTEHRTPKSLQFISVAQSCPALCDPMDCSTAGLAVHHQFLEFTQTHVQWVSDAIQPSHPLSLPSPLALSFPQHQRLFQSQLFI